MKLFIILGLLLSINVRADDPNFDTTTNIVTFPRVTVDNEVAFINLQLLLGPDGTWRVLDFELEPKPEPDVNLNGAWSGNLIVEYEKADALIFIPVIPCEVLASVTLVQSGNELTGTGTYSGACIENGGNGNVSGIVDGKNISFTISVNNEDFKFDGTISNDNLTFDIIGPSVLYEDNDAPRRWELSLQ